jgi:hypothetical protein
LITKKPVKNGIFKTLCDGSLKEKNGLTTTHKNNAEISLESKLPARLQRLIVLRTIKLTSSHCFYMRTLPKMPLTNKTREK